MLTGQYGDYGLPPSRSSFAIRAALVAHYLGGAFYPVGGASVFAEGIGPAIEQNGGHLAVSAEVSSIMASRSFGKALPIVSMKRPVPETKS